MYAKLFVSAGPILALPVVALMLFIAVFAGVVVSVLRKKPREFAAMAALPLAEEERS